MTGGLVEVLVVGAGPTGLALAAELAAFGVRARLIDRGLDRVHESRALAIQPRTLEVLAGLGVTGELIAGGNRAVELRMIIAIRPAARKNPNDVIRYRCPITLWSVVDSQAASSERLRGLRGAATGPGRICWS